MPERRGLGKPSLVLSSIGSPSEDTSKNTASASGTTSNKYDDEIFGHTWETCQQGENVWRNVPAYTFPQDVRSLILETRAKLDLYLQDYRSGKLQAGDPEFKLAEFYERVTEENDPFHLWLVLARCVKYELDDIEPDVEVLQLNLPKLVDSLYGSDESIKSLERMWTRALSRPYEFESLGNNKCSCCGKSFKPGDSLMQVRCKNRHEFHETCIKSHFVNSNECPDCDEIVYPERERFAESFGM